MKPTDPRPAFGTGYLYQWHDKYTQFDRDLRALGGSVDIYELLAIHFGPDCHGLDEFVAQRQDFFSGIGGMRIGGDSHGMRSVHRRLG